MAAPPKEARRASGEHPQQSRARAPCGCPTGSASSLLQAELSGPRVRSATSAQEGLGIRFIGFRDYGLKASCEQKGIVELVAQLDL